MTTGSLPPVPGDSAEIRLGELEKNGQASRTPRTVRPPPKGLDLPYIW